MGSSSQVQRSALVVLVQARGGIAAQGSRDEIAVGVVIVELAEKREQSPFCLAATHGLLTSASTNLHIVYVLEGIVAVGTVKTFGTILDKLSTNECAHMMYTTKSLQVVSGVGPGVGVALAVGTADTVHVAGLDAASQVLVEILGVFNTEVRLQCQSVEGLDVDIGVTEDTPRFVGVVASVIQLVYADLAGSSAFSQPM